ncbi:hypothetical protein BHYA_0259g00110 [Botrytis hyacinthi]|uniref:Uncharacterized protein n=1 Tax=Botrytis hyacinthi TaxID=278943 RepID=A0A4Z1GDS1_9HELO|nr:hypothetical protein BHYA_0259g00110 [Botrytis hyacinthi]
MVLKPASKLFVPSTFPPTLILPFKPVTPLATNTTAVTLSSTPPIPTGFPNPNESPEQSPFFNNNLPIARMIIRDTRERLGSRIGNQRLPPRIPHVMRFTRIVPRLEFDEIGLCGEDLVKAHLEIGFAAAIPVLRAVDVFELERGNTHHESFSGGFGGFLIDGVVDCVDGGVAGGIGGPGIPIECSV